MRLPHLLPAFLLSCSVSSAFAQPALTFTDPQPQRYSLTARASEIDPQAKPHPEINFTFESEDKKTKKLKPADVENASVDTRVAPRGQLMIWLMGMSEPLFERVNSYGIHALRVHYANGWFGQFGKEPPPADDQTLGKIRLEAATGEDFSPLVSIPQPDGVKHRALMLVKHLAKVNPQGRWDFFLQPDGKDLDWEKVIIAGASHGSTTSARFAKHQRVGRVVMFCGPRDQYESWHALPSATPAERYFGFSHVLDGGWSGDHYCRSWQMLGLAAFGPIIDVDKVAPPFGNSRRLITAGDVKGDAGRAHSSVMPGGAAVKTAKGDFAHEAVWRYLFTHPVSEVGSPVPNDADCEMELRK